jgi:hypothetical protein
MMVDEAGVGMETQMETQVETQATTANTEVGGQAGQGETIEVASHATPETASAGTSQGEPTEVASQATPQAASANTSQGEVTEVASQPTEQAPPAGADAGGAETTEVAGHTVVPDAEGGAVAGTGAGQGADAGGAIDVDNPPVVADAESGADASHGDAATEAVGFFAAGDLGEFIMASIEADADLDGTWAEGEEPGGAADMVAALVDPQDADQSGNVLVLEVGGQEIEFELPPAQAPAGAADTWSQDAGVDHVWMPGVQPEDDLSQAHPAVI